MLSSWQEPRRQHGSKPGRPARCARPQASAAAWTVPASPSDRSTMTTSCASTEKVSRLGGTGSARLCRLECRPEQPCLRSAGTNPGAGPLHVVCGFHSARPATARCAAYWVTTNITSTQYELAAKLATPVGGLAGRSAGLGSMVGCGSLVQRGFIRFIMLPNLKPCFTPPSCSI